MLIQHLFETPIEDMTFSGNWNKNSSFNAQDRKLLSNPKAQEKIKQKWLNTSTPFNVYFLNSVEGRRYREIGEVSRQWLYDNMPIFYEDMVRAGQITSDRFFNPDAINVVFTNNSGAERVPMTAWIMAHRFGHVLRAQRTNSYHFDSLIEGIDEYLGEILRLYHITTTQNFQSGKVFRDLELSTNILRFFETIGKMKSARDHELRSFYEFYYELIAQHLLQGKISFNDAPQSFKGYKGRIKSCLPGDVNYINSQLAGMAEIADDNIETILGASCGHVFIM